MKVNIKKIIAQFVIGYFIFGAIICVLLFIFFMVRVQRYTSTRSNLQNYSVGIRSDLFNYYSKHKSYPDTLFEACDFSFGMSETNLLQYFTYTNHTNTFELYYTIPNMFTGSNEIHYTPPL